MKKYAFFFEKNYININYLLVNGKKKILSENIST